MGDFDGGSPRQNKTETKKRLQSICRRKVMYENAAHLRLCNDKRRAGHIRIHGPGNPQGCMRRVSNAAENRQVFWLIARVLDKNAAFGAFPESLPVASAKAAANYSNGLAWDLHPTSMTCSRYSI